jgi:hypothetical protein
MSDTKAKPQAKEQEAIRERNQELERKVQAEGLDLEHPEGKERFEELLKRAASPRSTSRHERKQI